MSDADGRPLDDVLSRALSNVGPGPDPLSLSDVVDEHDFAVLLLQRDHYCTNCREQVQAVAGRYDAFRERDAGVVSVLPEPRERAVAWQSTFDRPDVDELLGVLDDLLEGRVDGVRRSG